MAQTADATAAADRLLGPNRRALTTGLVLVVTLIAFEALAVATALPVVERDLGGLHLYGLVFSAFMVANLLGSAYAGWLADRRSPAAGLLLGLVVFGAGLIISGAAPTMAVIVAGRAVQGLGSGAIATTAYVGIARGYEESLRPRMFAILSTAYVVPGLIGPVVSGAVAEHLSWRLVFLGLLPLLPLSAALTIPALRKLSPPAGSSPASGRGRLLLSAQLAFGAGLVLAGAGLGSVYVSVPVVAAGLVIAFFALQRLLPAGTFRAAPGLPAAVASMGLISLTFFGAEAFLPLALNEVRGQSPTVAGLVLTAATLTWTAGAWVQAQRAGEWSRRSMVVAGFGFVCAGIAIAGSATSTEVPALTAVLGWAVSGLGMGLAYANISLTILGEAADDAVGSASASLQLANVIGVASGTGISGAIVAAGDSAGWSQANGIALVFAVMVGFGVLAMAVATRLPRSALTPAAA